MGGDSLGMEGVWGGLRGGGSVGIGGDMGGSEGGGGIPGYGGGMRGECPQSMGGVCGYGGGMGMSPWWRGGPWGGSS